ncbi:MAG: patatin-like phospholipase family protein [Thermomonas hydrothermalis]|uniref:patatin-like phospholipase family protein n=1 Tax=Thermomonas hydrothermalis TaxID=213588 RepID=UPI002355D6C1|nr:patatin-like phospholipase family protein [Thermomonas hydrothermalis]MCL6619051.1 patatin-like phospholipase family protein [Thermomonas hydrothermalis]
MTASPSEQAATTPIALALSGGGARGLTQIGVIEVLQARGLYIDAVAGTSCGALVGGTFAAGKLDVLRDWMCRTSRNEMLRLLDPGLGRPAMFTGERLVRTLRELIGEPRIEDLPIDFTAVAVDLRRQREVWLRSGDLWDALRASFAIPGIFTPLMVGEMELVDGGLLSPLPITATRLAVPHRVIAVDLNGGRNTPRESVVASAPQHSPAQDTPLSRWLENAFHLNGNGRGPQRSGIMDVIARTLETMQERISRVQLALDPPDLLIEIPRDICLFYEFWRASELIDIGRQASEKALDAAGY